MHEIVLEEKMASYSVVDLVDKLRNQPGDVTLNGSHVVTIGSWAAEIILRYKNEIEGSGCKFRLKASQALADDLRIIGLSDLLLAQETEG